MRNKIQNREEALLTGINNWTGGDIEDLFKMDDSPNFQR
jgi:hypothetical protein